MDGRDLPTQFLHMYKFLIINGVSILLVKAQTDTLTVPCTYSLQDEVNMTLYY